METPRTADDVKASQWLLGVGCWDGQVRLYEIPSGHKVISLRGHDKDVTSLTFSHDGTHVFSAACDGTLRIWDLSTGTEKAKIQVAEPPTKLDWPILSISVSPDGSMIAVAINPTVFEMEDEYGIVQLWDWRRKKKCAETEIEKGIGVGIAWAPTGDVVATGNEGKLTLLEVPTLRTIRSIDISSPEFYNVAFSPDGTVLVVVDGAVTIGFDAETSKVLFTLEGYGNTTAISPDGRWIASSGYEGRCALFHLGSEKPTWKKQFPQSAWTTSISFSPDSQLLAAVEYKAEGKGGILHILRVEDGSEIYVLEKKHFELATLAFKPSLQ